jgi:hypothetical protein
LLDSADTESTVLSVEPCGSRGLVIE